VNELQQSLLAFGFLLLLGFLVIVGVLHVHRNDERIRKAEHEHSGPDSETEH